MRLPSAYRGWWADRPIWRRLQRRASLSTVQAIWRREATAGGNMHLGIREPAMGSILNGLALSKIRSYGSGFLIFSDYMRQPIRLSALMEIPVTYIFTHDSIGVGEDGPTHQPVEHLI